MQPYWLSRPGPAPDAAMRAEFDGLLAAALAAGPGTAIDYRLAAPKWQFLCHVADRGEAVLHGSSDPDIARFEPRSFAEVPDAFVPAQSLGEESPDPRMELGGLVEDPAMVGAGSPG